MINTVALMGRLTYEPELKTTTSGVSVIRFQIACDRNYQRSGSERQADFIDCVAWRQTAEFISRYFHKGSMIAVDGSIQTSNYTDKNGENRKSVEVVINNASFCGSKAETGTAAPAESQSQSYNQPAPSYSNADNSDFEEIIDDDDDLPF
ncbi:MAG: single-stranded DNA-binding protein [Eubacterium sp.]|nr:single-stranded DNA-binding protein [Eubacterium sp.]